MRRDSDPKMVLHFGAFGSIPEFHVITSVHPSDVDQHLISWVSLMPQNLDYWFSLYQRLKYQALCLDCEFTGRNSGIAVVGIYRPQNGEIEVTQLIKGQDLTAENIRELFKHCKLLITFNGIRSDLPALRQEFPGCVPNVPVIDLYLIARHLGLAAGLKLLEQQFNLEEPGDPIRKQFQAIRRWQRYQHNGDSNALRKLLEYNRQDVINLFPLAEYLYQKYTQGNLECSRS